ncbi:uncharacterized protein [Rutidosis leptorrhynchoides]|uniref:uncharacterized protein n=1 Tax=Rutidosis leptorrhynchoides TaxID=125765 RepID=UPI003A9A31D7
MRAWYDIWSDIGPLAYIISSRIIHDGGFNVDSKVRDIVVNGQWVWPIEWVNRFPLLANIKVPIFQDYDDMIKWKDFNGVLKDFSVSSAWNVIRTRASTIGWYDIVWFAQCVPRHAFLVWLLMGEKLKTQDKLQGWETRNLQDNSSVCSLCSLEMDSHGHLFFRCPFANRVWRCAWQYADILQSCDSWKDVVHTMQSIANKKSAEVIVAKLLFGASVYVIWQEQNDRLFQKKVRSYDKVFEAIYTTVRWKIMSIKWKNSLHVRSMKSNWKVP